MKLDDDLRAFLERVRVPVTLADAQAPDLPLVAVNERFCQLTGYGAEEIVATNCRFLQREDRDQPARGEIASAIAEARGTQVLLRNYRKDGTPFGNLLLLYPIARGSDGPRFYLGSQFEVPQDDVLPKVERHLDDLEFHLDRLMRQTLSTRAQTRRWLSDAVRNTLEAKLMAADLSKRRRS